MFFKYVNFFYCLEYKKMKIELELLYYEKDRIGENI